MPGCGSEGSGNSVGEGEPTLICCEKWKMREIFGFRLAFGAFSGIVAADFRPDVGVWQPGKNLVECQTLGRGLIPSLSCPSRDTAPDGQNSPFKNGISSLTFCAKMLKSILDFVAKVITPGTVVVAVLFAVILTLGEEHRFVVSDKIVSLLFNNYLLYGIMAGMMLVIWHLHSKSKEIIKILELENKRLIDENKGLNEDLRAYTKKILDIQEQKDEEVKQWTS